MRILSRAGRRAPVTWHFGYSEPPWRVARASEGISPRERRPAQDAREHAVDDDPEPLGTRNQAEQQPEIRKRQRGVEEPTHSS